MLSDKCKLRGLKGIQRLDRVGPYIVVANRLLYKIGKSRRYVLIHEAQLLVDSVHGSIHAAVIFALKHRPQAPLTSATGLPLS